MYIFDYDSGSATWITTSGDAANMEKIYIDASKRRYRGSTDWIYEDDRFVAGASLHGGTHKDAYQLGSISSVSISDDGTRIAVSTANYSAIDFVAAIKCWRCHGGNAENQSMSRDGFGFRIRLAVPQRTQHGRRHRPVRRIKLW